MNQKQKGKESEERNDEISDELMKIHSLQQIKYDATLIFAGVESGEGWDRADLSWSAEVLNVLKNFTVPGKVVGAMTAPGPVLINNLRDASDALLFNIMPGEEYGRGITNILFGKASPEAKLTFTMPNIENEQKMTVAQYPGSDGNMNSSYSEKHHFGYRWYD
jgi:beta-glucosidase